MKTNRFLSFLAIFALAFTLFACSSDSSGNDGGGGDSSSSLPPSSPSSDGNNLGVIEPLNKFEAKPASEVGKDKIKYSYSYEDYDFYYIYLGELKNIPLFGYTTQYHDGTKTTYTVSNAETIKQSVEETITNSSQTAIGVVEDYTTSEKSPRKVSEEIGIENKYLSQAFDFLAAKLSGEKGWDEYTNNKTSSFHKTTSLTNTITAGTEYTKTNLVSRSWELGKDNNVGYYRYTLFSASDVYIYVIKDATGVIYYEFKECVIPDVYFWRFDYSETPSFRKSDATSFKFDVSMLDNLPKPEISLTSSSSSSIVNLVRKNITLSAAGSSYADIDGNVATYTLATASSRQDEIDLIAYCGKCAQNSIYSPLAIDFFDSDVFFVEIPATQASIFKTATKLSEIEPTLNSLLNIADFEVEIPIVAGKVFLVYTSEGEVRIVIIKSAGTQTVDLEIIQVPSN